jgi:mRNA-degrading endonuclease RelE of RelBE toxin-antitoxin system
LTRIRIANSYRKAERRIPQRIRLQAGKALSTLMEAPDRPGLNFERLPGWDDTYSIRVTRGYRILLKREADEVGEFFTAVDIGTHQVYRR